MAKKSEFPGYHIVTVETTNGEKFKTKSCFKGDVIVLDLDPYNHPAWKSSDQAFINVKDNQITKFYKKYSGFKN